MAFGNKNKKNKNKTPGTVEDCHHVGGVHVGGFDYGVITDGRGTRVQVETEMRTTNRSDTSSSSDSSFSSFGSHRNDDRHGGSSRPQADDGMRNSNRHDTSQNHQERWNAFDTAKEKQEDTTREFKSHHNVGGVHIGGNNYGTITVSGEKNPRARPQNQNRDRHGNVGGYHIRGDNEDDIHI